MSLNQEEIKAKIKPEIFAEFIQQRKSVLQKRIDELRQSLVQYREIRRREEGAVIEYQARLQRAKDDELACSMRLDEIQMQLQRLDNPD